MQPASKSMAFLSDVHGHLEPLERVLAELARRDVQDIFVAGDLLLGGDEPLEVWRRLQEVGARCTRGTSDLALATIDPDSLNPSDEQQAQRADLFARTRRAVGDLVVQSLRQLPERLRIPMIDGREILMTHESPMPAAKGGGEMSVDMDDEDLHALIDSDPADLFIVGATHVPFQRAISDIHIVNVGAVGEAAGGGVAHFTIVRPKLEGTEILQDFVRLDG